MKTTRAKVEFARLPKDYAGLCRVLSPRSIHDKVDFGNVTEITNTIAGHKLTPDQEDYFELLCRLMTDSYSVAAQREGERALASTQQVLRGRGLFVQSDE